MTTVNPTSTESNINAQKRQDKIRKVSRNVSVCVLLVSLVMVSLDATAVGLINSGQAKYIFMSLWYSGVWGGALCTITGIVGIIHGCSKSKKNLCLNIAVATMSVITISIAACATAFQATAAGLCSAYHCTASITALHSVGAAFAGVNLILHILLIIVGCLGICCRFTQTSRSGQVVILSNVPVRYQEPPRTTDMTNGGEQELQTKTATTLPAMESQPR